MRQTFRRKDNAALIVEVRANLPPGQVDDEDAPVRYTVHRTLDGVQVELRDSPPVPISGDQPITLDVPLISAADLATVRAMRLGTHGLPIVWSNDVVTARDVIIVRVQSKPWPGAIGAQNQRFRATIVLQPL